MTTMIERHREFQTPAEEVGARIGRLQRELKAAGAAVGWIEHLTDRLYFSGSAQDGVLLVPVAGEPIFYVRKSFDRAVAESSLNVEPYPGGRAIFALLEEMLDGGKLAMALDVTQASQYARLLATIDPLEVVDLSATVRALRATKSEWEQRQIRAAAEQYNRLFDVALDWLKEPITELELTARVEGRLRELGHGGTIRLRRPTADIALANVVSGDTSLHPTNFNGCVGGEGPYPATPACGGWKPLESGTSIMFDIVTSYNGYQADNTRSFFMGETAPDELVEAHQFCVDVLQQIESRMRPGAICSEIFREVRGWVEERGEPVGFMGYGDNRVKFFGHGVGLDLDEMPVIADRIDVALEPGMILAVEPKAFLPGIGPAGVENTYVINADGCESFCPLPLELITVAR